MRLQPMTDCTAGGGIMPHAAPTPCKTSPTPKLFCCVPVHLKPLDWGKAGSQKGRLGGPAKLLKQYTATVSYSHKRFTLGGLRRRTRRKRSNSLSHRPQNRTAQGFQFYSLLLPCPRLPQLARAHASTVSKHAIDYSKNLVAQYLRSAGGRE
jgi:hypothetical protein